MIFSIYVSPLLTFPSHPCHSLKLLYLRMKLTPLDKDATSLWGKIYLQSLNEIFNFFLLLIILPCYLPKRYGVVLERIPLLRSFIQNSLLSLQVSLSYTFQFSCYLWYECSSLEIKYFPLLLLFFCRSSNNLYMNCGLMRDALLSSMHHVIVHGFPSIVFFTYNVCMTKSCN